MGSGFAEADSQLVLCIMAGEMGIRVSCYIGLPPPRDVSKLGPTFPIHSPKMGFQKNFFQAKKMYKPVDFVREIVFEVS